MVDDDADRPKGKPIKLIVKNGMIDFGKILQAHQSKLREEKETNVRKSIDKALMSRQLFKPNQINREREKLEQQFQQKIGYDGDCIWEANSDADADLNMDLETVSKEVNEDLSL